MTRVLRVLAVLFFVSVSLAGAEAVELTFFGWSDQHITTEGKADHLVPAIQAMNKIAGFDYPEDIGGKVAKPAFVFGCGDITEWPTRAARDTYAEYMRFGLRYPSFDIAGNHDLGGDSPSDTITDWLKMRHGSLRYTFDMEGVHFVMLFSEYDEKLKQPAQPISKKALGFLRADLAKVGKGVPVVIATHLCYDAITNKDEFVDAMSGANVICVLGGHYHKAKVDKHKGISFVQLPSPAEGSPSEFTVVRITGDRITAVPFDYGKRQWATEKGKVLDEKIKGPKAPRTVKNVRTLSIGDSAPEFMLAGVDNKYWSLKDFADAEVLVVLFTCNHCPTAQAYEGRIKKLVADYKKRGVAVVAISPNDPLAVRLDELGYSDLSDSFVEMKIRAMNAEFEFPYLYDGENQRVSREYGPERTPHVFVFDKARKLRYEGRIDDSEKGDVKVRDARNAIDALLAGRDVAVETTRVFGCSVKWADKRESASKSAANWAKEEVTLGDIDAEGIERLLKNDSDKLRLINVWATWCGPCRMEFPELVTINRMYRKRDFEMITISSDRPDARANVLTFLTEQRASCTNYIFSSGDINELSKALGGHWQGAIPFTLIIKPGGEILHMKEGMIHPLETRMVIVDYLGRVYK